ncbi:hypothetical protein [Flavilitoribacter nigricans]|uniref:Outer membrane protein beta-barrel domain-containing protein n=1 Tax=Flavilitoribacter nigricans (strain ATCC 23147 / DSM 23189 / NBRC 102662 / NCIMB 1420 / SS-2) TaxID=1122177 RepID=A0A2D0N914_FLAN2|nr:hypothetical protein [Flavilitoribacter nigricans]PHN04975.1 hypothetical protein CRP01_18265 [Flavilitoribacter nigricans DSM 23189 = NBRC 102662]
MKNDKHPIDDLFQRGLNQHAVPPPMHVWERIEESRGRSHRHKLVFMRQKFTIISSAAAVLLLGVWLGWSETPALGSFPLAGNHGAFAQDLNGHALTDQPLELLAQQAGILPDVGAIIQKKQTAPKPVAIAEVPAAPITTAPASYSLAIKGAVPAENTIASITQKETTAASEAPVSPAPVRQSVALPAALDQSEKDGGKYIPTYLNTIAATPIPIPETGCARFSEGRPAIFLAVTAGPSLLNRTFSSKSDEYLDYANQRSTTETPQLSYGATARLSIVFPWGGAIRSGVGYTQFNERMVYRNSKVRQTTITDIYGPNGEVIGSDTTYLYEDTVLKYGNRHRMIDIPFQLGYEVRYNKVTLAANAGVNLNVAYSGEGSYLGPRDLLPTRFDNDDTALEPVYKTKVGLSWQASLGLHYQLNDRLDLMAEPYLRYYPESFTRSDYPLSQKYLVGGVGLGLRVLL